jgi:hypothetical protein
MHPLDQDALDAVLLDHGAAAQVIASIPDVSDETVGRFLDQMERGMHSWTWRMDEELRRRAVVLVRDWAVGHFGSLDVPLAPEYRLVVRRNDLP